MSAGDFTEGHKAGKPIIIVRPRDHERIADEMLSALVLAGNIHKGLDNVGRFKYKFALFELRALTHASPPTFYALRLDFGLLWNRVIAAAGFLESKPTRKDPARLACSLPPMKAVRVLLARAHYPGVPTIDLEQRVAISPGEIWTPRDGAQ